MKEKFIALFKQVLLKIFQRKNIKFSFFFVVAFIINSFVLLSLPMYHYFKMGEQKNKGSKNNLKIVLTKMNLKSKRKKTFKKVRKLKLYKTQHKRRQNDRFKISLNMAGVGGASLPVLTGKNLIYKEGDVDTLPVFKKGRPLVTPSLARAAGVTGYVELRLVIDETGKVIDVNVIDEKSSNGYGFRDKAISVAWSYEFVPAKLKKIPVKIEVIQPFRFK